VKKLFAGRLRYAEVATPLLVDAGNQACVQAIHRIARGAGELALPLVVVGPPDSGKSRVLEEAGNLVARRGGAVAGGTVKDLTTRLRDALKTKSVEKLITALDDADLLLVDEVHRAASAPKTRAFLVARIESRIQRRRPTIVASRHAPKDVRGLGAREASLLLGGCLLHVARPGAGVRRRYLTLLSKGALPAAQAERLCQASTGGLGALRRAFLDAAGNPGFAGRLRAEPAALLTALAREFDVKPSEIAGRRKNPAAVRARGAFVELARRAGLADAEIRSALDHREPLAIRRIHEKARAALRQEPEYAARLERAAALLGAEELP
jgi:chromosomal replication initiation ATPase DnaA